MIPVSYGVSTLYFYKYFKSEVNILNCFWVMPLHGPTGRPTIWCLLFTPELRFARVYWIIISSGKPYTTRFKVITVCQRSIRHVYTSWCAPTLNIKHEATSTAASLHKWPGSIRRMVKISQEKLSLLFH